jgi:hypothetical protein
LTIVRFNGKTWVFRQIEDDKFSRREVPIDRTTDKGVVTRENMKPGDRITVALDGRM